MESEQLRSGDRVWGLLVRNRAGQGRWAALEPPLLCFWTNLLGLSEARRSESLYSVAELTCAAVGEGPGLAVTGTSGEDGYCAGTQRTMSS